MKATFTTQILHHDLRNVSACFHNSKLLFIHFTGKTYSISSLIEVEHKRIQKQNMPQFVYKLRKLLKETINQQIDKDIFNTLKLWIT